MSPTFVRTEVVDARQFTGSVKSAKDIVAWVHANEGIAAWMYGESIHHDGTRVMKTITQNVIQLTLSKRADGTRRIENDLILLSPSCWVLVRQNGALDWRTDEQMKTEFQVQ